MIDRNFLVVAVLLLVLTGSCFGSVQQSERDYVAYSLNEAEYRLRGGADFSDTLHNIAGINRLVALVLDSTRNDLILVGKRERNGPNVSLDDFVVALRAILLHGSTPMVSIDPTATTYETGQQIVRFAPGLDDTPFGEDLLKADIALKQLSLGLIDSVLTEADATYLDLSAREILERSGKTGWEYTRHFFSGMSRVALNDSVLKLVLEQIPSSECERLRQAGKAKLGDNSRLASRFWFYPDAPSFVTRRAVYTVQSLKTRCECEIMYAYRNGKRCVNLAEVRDRPGEEFAALVTSSFAQVAERLPEIRRLQSLFDLVALARGVEELSLRQLVEYWLSEYDIPEFDTQDSVSVEAGVVIFSSPEHAVRVMQVSGGVELNPTMLRIESGDGTALRDLVLDSRPPDQHSLFWRVPLEGWPLNGIADSISREEAVENPLADIQGCVVDVAFYELGGASNNIESQLLDHFYGDTRAGVTINPVPTFKVQKQVDFWQSIFSSRPADTTLYWDVDLKTPEE